jgi:glutaredoxin
VKEFLSREHVPFVARNVDEDDEAYRELIARGFRTVPVTFIGERAVRGWDEAALRDALRGGQSSPDR